jgi:hypothetical protein
LHYADPHRPSGRDAAAGPAPSEPRKKKPAKGGSTAVETPDPDDLLFEEYKAIVAQETTQLPPEPVERPEEASTQPRRRRIGVLSHGAAARDTGHGARDASEEATMACVRAYFDKVHIRMRPNIHEPSDPRPANAVFLLREGFGDIGIAFDPMFSTTTLRSYLLGINDYDWDDGFVVACGDNYVPMGSTLGEQSIAPGARLRLVRPVDVIKCQQRIFDV